MTPIETRDQLSDLIVHGSAHPSSLAHAVALAAIRAWGPAKAGTFADCVVRAVQIEARRDEPPPPATPEAIREPDVDVIDAIPAAVVLTVGAALFGLLGLTLLLWWGM